MLYWSKIIVTALLHSYSTTFKAFRILFWVGGGVEGGGTIAVLHSVRHWLDNFLYLETYVKRVWFEG